MSPLEIEAPVEAPPLTLCERLLSRDNESFDLDHALRQELERPVVEHHLRQPGAVAQDEE